MAAVGLRGVTKRFGNPAGDTVALDDIELEVPHGERLVILGPSGSGKTTLLRIIAGLEPATSGEVRLGDTIVDRLPPSHRNVAMVFQHGAFYPHLNVRENLAFGLKLRGVAASDRQRQTDHIAHRLGLRHLLDQNPHELSGGEQQRVALGRALLRNPQVFLFDEPLSQLDAPQRAELRREILRQVASAGGTMIHVTHDQEEAFALADRIAVLDQGRLRQVGPPGELYARPAHVAVARLLGSPLLNLISGTFRDGVFSGPAGQALTWRTEWPQVQQGRRLILGVSAAELELTSVTELPSRFSWAGTVDSVEPEHPRLGAQLIHVGLSSSGNAMSAENHPAASRSHITIRSRRADVPSTGERVHVSWERVVHWHWFDADSGMRLEESRGRVNYA